MRTEDSYSPFLNSSRIVLVEEPRHSYTIGFLYRLLRAHLSPSDKSNRPLELRFGENLRRHALEIQITAPSLRFGRPSSFPPPLFGGPPPAQSMGSFRPRERPYPGWSVQPCPRRIPASPSFCAYPV